MKCTLLFLSLFVAQGDSRLPPEDGAPAASTPRVFFLEALARLEALEQVDRTRFLEELSDYIQERLRARPDVDEGRDATRSFRKNLLLGLAVLFDGTEALERSPFGDSLSRDTVRSEDERRRRRHLCGWVRIHGRHDAVAHVFLSAAITAIAGPYLAERVGRHKEIRDAERARDTSDTWQGFSFIDLAYDLAGIRYACRILGWGDPALLDEPPAPLLAFLPHFDTLEVPERLDWTEFHARFQGSNSAAFRALIARIHRHLDDSLAPHRARR